MSLTKEEREKLPEEHFAVPGKRKLPIHDATHTKLAWDMLDRTQGLTPAEKSTARHRILRRAKELGIDTKGWNLTASFTIEAMAIEMPEVADHPNKMPFSGILTRLDQPSDNPVGGAMGKRVLISKSVAEAALPSLLGMAVDFTPNLDGHDNQSKIGIFTEATVEGDAIHVKGFFYAHDFPVETGRIKAEKDKLGFSYECQSRIQDLSADPWVVEACMFTGAAVLYKDRAAYTTTSLAAHAAEEQDAMTKEELDKLNATLATLAASVDTINKGLAEVKEAQAKTISAAGAVHEMVKPHAEKLRSCAAAMEAAGIGTNADRGHVKVLRHMADRMEAESMLGQLPHIYRDHDYLSGAAAVALKPAEPDPETKKTLETLTASVATVTTALADLKAAAFTQAAQPERKTLTPEIQALLGKHNLAAAANDGTLTVAQVDEALKGLPAQQRIEQKLKLMASGVLPATKSAA